MQIRSAVVTVMGAAAVASSPSVQGVMMKSSQHKKTMAFLENRLNLQKPNDYYNGKKARADKNQKKPTQEGQDEYAEQSRDQVKHSLAVKLPTRKGNVRKFSDLLESSSDGEQNENHKKSEQEQEQEKVSVSGENIDEDMGPQQNGKNKSKTTWTTCLNYFGNFCIFCGAVLFVIFVICVICAFYNAFSIGRSKGLF